MGRDLPVSPLSCNGEMFDLDSFRLEECPSCSTALDSLAEEGLCYRCASALHDVSTAIEAFTHELRLLSFDETSAWVM